MVRITCARDDAFVYPVRTHYLIPPRIFFFFTFRAKMKGFSPWPGRVSGIPPPLLPSFVTRARIPLPVNIARVRAHARPPALARSYLAVFALVPPRRRSPPRRSAPAVDATGRDPRRIASHDAPGRSNAARRYLPPHPDLRIQIGAQAAGGAYNLNPRAQRIHLPRSTSTPRGTEPSFGAFPAECLEIFLGESSVRCHEPRCRRDFRICPA